MSQQQRMKDREPGSKARVFKHRPDGMWWADVRRSDGSYVCDVFFRHETAVRKACEYAAGQQ